MLYIYRKNYINWVKNTTITKFIGALINSGNTAYITVFKDKFKILYIGMLIAGLFKIVDI